MELCYIPGIERGLSYLARAVTDSAAEKKHVWIVIPDQMAVTVEDALSREAPPSAQLYYDIVSFGRLADNIFRREGGVIYDYADRAAEAVTMWRAISACRKDLLVYDRLTPDGVDVILDAVGELKQSMVAPEDLMRAAVRLSADGAAAGVGKYIDIANIYETYDRLLTDSYSDRISALTYAVDRARDGGFFAGSEVILFAFSGFTAQQNAMIRVAAKQADACRIVFAIPGDARQIGRRPEFDGIEKTRDRLRAAAEAERVPFSVTVADGRREDVIGTLAESLFDTCGSISDAAPEGIAVIEAESRRGEAEAAAIEIASAVRGGMRYRDIAVCTGSVESYRGIIDSMFDDYAIPYHMSDRVRVEKMPEAAALTAALRVISGGWRRDDIAAYIKTGLSGLTVDEEDELLLYMTTWNLGGRRFRDPDGGVWSMNPDGYTATWTEEGERMLADVNGARRTVTGPLLKLSESFGADTDAAAKTAAVREFLSRITEKTDAVRAQLADIVEGALSAVELSSPDGAMTADEYISCLDLAIRTLSVGTIPGRTDEVEISDTIGMRGSGHKLVIMLGVADGELPAGGGGGFFSEAERCALEGAGVRVGEDDGYRAAMELYNFIRCASDAEEKLIFTYRTSADGVPSVIGRISELYPALKTKKHRGVLGIEGIFSRSGAVSQFTRIEDAALREAVILETADDGDMKRTLAGLSVPISSPHVTVSDKTAEKLFGGDIYFSQSRLEDFVSCRFGFYCKHILGLRERGRAAIGYTDIGTFVHELLEKMFSSGIVTREDVTEEELEAAADGAIAEYIAAACPRDEETARVRDLFRRLRRSVLLFLRSFRQEFAASKFRPVLFEVPFGLGEGTMPPLEIPLGGGRSAYLRGIADRIDTYRDGEGNLYVRVIDYKSGNHTFSPDDIAEGHNIQLPLYLYTFVSEANAADIGGEEGDRIVPAGFLYVKVRPDDIKVGVGSGETYRETDKLARQGILLADEAVLRAQDPEMSGEFIPVRLKKDGSPDADSVKSLTDGGGFDRMYGELCRTVGRISSELRSGLADAEPTPHGGVDPCEYCAAKSVCRSAKKKGR